MKQYRVTTLSVHKQIKIGVLLVVLFFSGLRLIAQENNVLFDSLRDESRKNYFSGNFEKAFEINDYVLKLAIEKKEKKYQIYSLNTFMFYSINDNKYLPAFNASEEAIHIAKEIKNDTLLAYLYIYRSELLAKINNTDGAITYLLKAKRILMKFDDYESSLLLNSTLALFYYNQKEYSKAIQYFKLALEQYAKKKDTNNYRGAFDNIGLCYRNLGNYKLAEFYFKQAIHFSKSFKSDIGEVNANINLAVNYSLQKDFNKAISIANYTVSLIKKYKITDNYLIEISTQLAKIYLEKKDLKKLDSVMNQLGKLFYDDKVISEQRLNYLEVVYKRNKMAESPNYVYDFENFIAIKDSLEGLKKVKLDSGVSNKYEIAEKLENYTDIEQNLKIEKVEKTWAIYLIIIISIAVIVLSFLIYKAQKNIKNANLLKEEITKKNKELEILNKQKDYILATVAHDLRGPIGNISSITSFIEEETVLSEDNKNFIKLINQSVDLSLNIISDLVDAIALDNKTMLLKQDKILLKETIETVLRMLQTQINKKEISIHTDYFDGLEIKGDKNLIIRVFFNIISNAVKFGRKNTEIAIETILFDENNVLIKIIDNGIGIEEEHLAAIFEPFTALSKKGTAGEKSTGLGLSIAKKIVELHHGRIWVESKLDEGSTFNVVLPLNYLNQILKSIPANF
ncbi:MAG: tetratricopeptide repeat-containing sensor histidine kinase [Bacteroidota bacterium]